MRDVSPVGNTCPRIDEVISAIKSRNWDDTLWSQERLFEIMESIRKDNALLREWGNSLNEQLDEAENEISELKRNLTKPPQP